MLYFLACPFSAFHIHETENEQDAPIGVFRGPTDGDICLEIEHDGDDVENVERERAELHE